MKVHKCVKNVGDLWNVLVVLFNYFVMHLAIKNISLILVVEEVCMVGYVINLLDNYHLAIEKVKYNIII